MERRTYRPTYLPTYLKRFAITTAPWIPCGRNRSFLLLIPSKLRTFAYGHTRPSLDRMKPNQIVPDGNKRKHMKANRIETYNIVTPFQDFEQESVNRNMNFIENSRNIGKMLILE